MVLRTLLKRNTYYDSITLMSVAQTVKALPGVDDVGAVMATETNRELLRLANLLPAAWLAEQETPPEAGDLLLVVRANDDEHAETALLAAEQRLTSRDHRSASETAIEQTTRSLEMALRRDREANLAFIAVAGEHAWLETEQALRHGLHVFLFSDNVPIEQELRLKQLAVERGLLLMGPDCGTALLHGVALGFCNVVPAGAIGIVGASGTGMQQVMSLIASAGMGISQAIGTGGRDLSETIHGLMMRQGLAMLAHDPHTSVIVLISKPPSPRVAREILAAAQIDKPVVVVFLGADPAQSAPVPANITFTRTLTEGAMAAVALAGGQHTHGQDVQTVLQRDKAKLEGLRGQLQPSQHYIRALYSGGTLCDEAMLLLREAVGPVASNIPLQTEWRVAEGELFLGHTALDLGSDEFTRGRPHPMIDSSVRLTYLEQAARDPETAVILLDIVLGFCAHPDPAAIYGPAIVHVRNLAASNGRPLPVIVSLCGTEGDPQRFSVQRQALEDAGALVYESNAVAALAAAALVNRQ